VHARSRELGNQEVRDGDADLGRELLEHTFHGSRTLGDVDFKLNSV
jgi:hypothetical protein